MTASNRLFTVATLAIAMIFSSASAFAQAPIVASGRLRMMRQVGLRAL